MDVQRPPLADPPSAPGRYVRLALKIALVAAVLVGAHVAGDSVLRGLGTPVLPSSEPALHRMVMLATAAYIVLIMLPFVPGIEIGLGLIALLGVDIVPLVYGSTILGLTLSFLIGRLVPHDAIIATLGLLRLRRTSKLLARLEPLESQQRLEFLLQRSSSQFVPYLLRYRYLALAVALNMPGNALIGGGGGICLAAGFSRLFPLPTFVLAVAVAVSPLPLFLIVTSL